MVKKMLNVTNFLYRVFQLETSMQEKVMTYKQQIPVLNQKISSLNETMTEKTMSFEEG